MWIKWVVLTCLALIIINLAQASAAMFKGDEKTLHTHLVWRIGLSLLLFVFILALYALGLIEPSDTMVYL